MADSYSVKARLSALDSGFSSTLKSCTGALESFGSKLTSGFNFGFFCGSGFNFALVGCRFLDRFIGNGSFGFGNLRGRFFNLFINRVRYRRNNEF